MTKERIVVETDFPTIEERLLNDPEMTEERSRELMEMALGFAISQQPNRAKALRRKAEKLIAKEHDARVRMKALGLLPEGRRK